MNVPLVSFKNYFCVTEGAEEIAKTLRTLLSLLNERVVLNEIQNKQPNKQKPHLVIPCNLVPSKQFLFTIV